MQTIYPLLAIKSSSPKIFLIHLLPPSNVKISLYKQFILFLQQYLLSQKYYSSSCHPPTLKDVSQIQHLIHRFTTNVTF